MPKHKLPQPQRIPIVAVTWEDALYSEYCNRPNEPYICATVGYELMNDKKGITLAMEFGVEFAQPRHVVFIPRAYLTSYRVLEKEAFMLQSEGCWAKRATT